MSANFDVVAGDTRTVQVTVRDVNGVVVNIAVANPIIWQLSRMPFGTDIILAKSLGSGVTIVDGPNGVFNVVLSAGDTGILAGVYFHFARVTIGAAVSTILLGTMTVTPATGLITVDLFMARFPEFAGVSRALIQMVIDQSLPLVGEIWTEIDRIPALLYLVAHTLTLEGEPNRSAILAAGGSAVLTTLGPVKRRKVGDVETEYAGSTAVGAGGATLTGFSATSYGRLYLQILRRNFPAFAVA